MKHPIQKLKNYKIPFNRNNYQRKTTVLVETHAELECQHLGEDLPMSLQLKIEGVTQGENFLYSRRNRDELDRC